MNQYCCGLLCTKSKIPATAETLSKIPFTAEGDFRFCPKPLLLNRNAGETVNASLAFLSDNENRPSRLDF